MGDARNRLSLIKACFGQQRSRRNKEDPFEYAFFDLWQQIGRQRYGRAAAAGASRMGVLFLTVEDFNAAVHMLFFDIKEIGRAHV